MKTIVILGVALIGGGVCMLVFAALSKKN